VAAAYGASAKDRRPMLSSIIARSELAFAGAAAELQ